MKKKNILYIMTDQQCRNTLGLYGLLPVKTPHLDSLAADAMRFDQAYTVCPLCTPARASMLTGRYPHAHGLLSNFAVWPDSDFPADTKLLNHYLKSQKYRTGYIGKWHCGESQGPSDFGFEGLSNQGVLGYGGACRTREYEDYLQKNHLERNEIISQYDYYGGTFSGYSRGDIRANQDYFLSSYAMDLLDTFEQESPDQPWFLFLSFWNPHSPLIPPEEYRELYSPESIELSGTLHEDLSAKPEYQAYFRDNYCNTAWTENDWKNILCSYYGQITFLDAQIGRLLEYLKKQGTYDDTLILFSADHGDYLGAHGGMHDKERALYEEIMKVPLIVKLPQGESHPGVCHKFVSNMDLAASCLDFAGIEIPDNFHSRSLLSLARKPESEWDDDFVAEFNGHKYLASSRMVRFSHWKYCYNPGTKDELYDLSVDSGEQYNLIDKPQYTEIVKESKDRLLKWMQKTDDNLCNWSQNYLSQSGIAAQ